MPKYDYKRRQDIKFINPYTFIPVPKENPIVRKPLEPLLSARVHTGVLKCRVYVRTPLGIPDTEKDNADEKYPFFSYCENGKSIPVIPGSSLRGVVRSVFETATDSCFATLRENTGLSKRIGNRKAYKPGILRWKNGSWHLYQAERYLLAIDPNRGERSNYRKYEDLPEDTYVKIIQKNETRIVKTMEDEELRFGDWVYFQPYTEGKGTYKKGKHLIWNGVARNVTKNALESTCESERKKGLVYIGEPFARKKHGESIFTLGSEEKGLTGKQLSKAYEGLLETLRIYGNSAINRNKGHRHSGYKDFKHAKKEEGIPVWYSTRDKKLSLASIGRIFYNTSLNDLIGERNPCINRKNLCEACALFGMAGDESLGSRIRITDARAQNGYILKEETLKILGQPRYSYLPFYAKSGDNTIPSPYDDKNIEIAGRKFYWHNQKAATDREIYATKAKTKMNSTMELVMPGAEFCFDIYYDGITEEQLQKLMWCIHFGENDKDGNLCHKLGHGKPLGLGSVKIVIEEKAERIFEEGCYRWEKEAMPKLEKEPEFKRSNEIKRVMDFRGLNKNTQIKYPYICNKNGHDLSESGGNESARHMWYLNNKEANKSGNDSVEILPEILSKNQELHPYEIKK